MSDESRWRTGTGAAAGSVAVADVQYDTATLDAGGRDAAVTADAAGAVAAGIAGIAIDAAVFGRVDQAASLTADLTAFRHGAAALGRAVQAAHVGIETPHVEEFVRNTDPATGEVFVRPGNVRAATPDEVKGLL